MRLRRLRQGGTRQARQRPALTGRPPAPAAAAHPGVMAYAAQCESEKTPLLAASAAGGCRGGPHSGGSAAAHAAAIRSSSPPAACPSDPAAPDCLTHGAAMSQLEELPAGLLQHVMGCLSFSDVAQLQQCSCRMLRSCQAAAEFWAARAEASLRQGPDTHRVWEQLCEQAAQEQQANRWGGQTGQPLQAGRVAQRARAAPAARPSSPNPAVRCRTFNWLHVCWCIQSAAVGPWQPDVSLLSPSSCPNGALLVFDLMLQPAAQLDGHQTRCAPGKRRPHPCLRVVPGHTQPETPHGSGIAGSLPSHRLCARPPEPTWHAMLASVPPGTLGARSVPCTRVSTHCQPGGAGF